MHARTIGDLPPAQLASLLASRQGLRIGIGPFTVAVHATHPTLLGAVRLMYAHHPLVGDDQFADLHVGVAGAPGLRRWLRPQVQFQRDNEIPFLPLPANQAAPLLEWGLNYAVANSLHSYLILHAAVVERSGRCLVLPGQPGAGKSTLCAALCHAGWRLFSDELCMLDWKTGQIQPLPRPISLKNESVPLMQRRLSDSTMTEVARDTQKGDVALLRPPKMAVALADVTAPPALVVHPQYRRGAPTQIAPMAKGESLMGLAGQAFNYHLLGSLGFTALSGLVETSAHYSLEYSELDDALPRLEQLLDQ